MAITGNSDTRCIKAVQIVADAGQWLKCRMADGRKAYGIRSSRDADHIYFVTRETCDCDDARRHPGQAYKHSIAARIHCARVTGTQMAASDTIDALAGMAVQRLETRVEFDARTGSVRQAPRELTAEEIAAERALFAHL